MTPTFHFILAHLWESTLFGLGCGFLILLLGKSWSFSRHLLAWASLVKFLIPLSVFSGATDWIKGLWTTTPETLSPTLPHLSSLSQTLRLETWISLEPQQAVTVTSFPWDTITYMIWSLGLVFLLASWTKQYLRVRSSIRLSCNDADLGWKELAQRLWERPNRPVPRVLSCSNEELVAGVFGMWRPIIIIPAIFPKEFTELEREAFLRHEFQHIYKRDYLWIVLQKFIRNLVWFHPLVWWLDHQISAEREIMRDAEVILKTKNIPSYLNCLMKAANFKVPSNYANSVGIKGSPFSKRIKAISRFQPTRLLDRLSALGSITAILTLTVFLSSSISKSTLHGAEKDSAQSETASIIQSQKDLRKEIQTLENSLKKQKRQLQKIAINLEVKKRTAEEVSQEEQSDFESARIELKATEASLLEKRTQFEELETLRTIALRIELHQLESALAKDQFTSEDEKADTLERIEVINKVLAIDSPPNIPIAHQEEKELFKEYNQLKITNKKAALEFLLSAKNDDSTSAMDFTIGLHHYKDDNIDEAKKSFESALTKYPNFQSAAKLLGYCYLQKEQWEEAKLSFEDSILLGEDDPRTFGLLGMIYLNLGNLESSEFNYRKAIAKDPETLDWWKGLAQVIWNKDGEKEGLKMVDVINKRFGAGTVVLPERG